ncbi:hypothetical protein JM946_01350 [Steroidobacter sp. S1-65]|uniref:PRC-barrel domain-containing protein n=1 Tax=Steroidobacter gossypii TaxID=2805490 RepID=A0ABS1WQV6_9GAMM|nr:PRC-barrel domain-containing protein [Steroidobacter gossypii]MBM0103365.1 hypothetical protein [Steroidobacter gossypii]
MLRPLSSLQKFAIRAVDGDIGAVADCYFDDRQWVVRYLVVDTQRWLPGSRKVLISPYSVSGIDWQNECVNVSITREQVKSSPSIDLDKPVSRQHETDFLDYYGYPYYWGGGMLWGVAASPAIARPPAGPEMERELRQRREAEDADPHLRSADYVSGYNIQARDGVIGHVDDFIFDEQSWEVRFFVIDTRNWLPGRHVVLATEWIEEVNWEQSLVHVPLTRDAIRASPEWDEDESLSESAEQSLYAHYGRTRDVGLRSQRHR